MIQKINKYLNKQNNFFIRIKYQITKKKKKLRIHQINEHHLFQPLNQQKSTNY
jgi:hypothetical protein